MSESPVSLPASEAPNTPEGVAASVPAWGYISNRFASVFLVTAAVVVVGLSALNGAGRCSLPYVCGRLTADDITQSRLDTALPVPQAGPVLEQSFTPTREGLAEIELILVRYGGDPSAGDESWFRLDLLDEHGDLIASQTFAGRQLQHNQTLTMRFDPQPRSAGQTYRLRLSGSHDNHLSAWGYSLDVYAGGELTTTTDAPDVTMSETAARELRFTTRYDLSIRDAAVITGAIVVRESSLLLAAMLYIPLPGVLLLLLSRVKRWDGAAWVGAAFALGAAAWPLVWYWTSIVGGRWSGPILWASVILGWSAALVIVLRRRSATTIPAQRPSLNGRTVLIYVPLTLLLIVSVSSRFVAVRDLAFPPWVDSSRHGLITAVMVASGRTPSDYRPFLPVDRFPYHFGAHTLSAGLVLMTGRAIPDVLLYLGQLLNGLLPLTVYSAAWMVTRRRAVGLLAAFLVALPFFFPGYYATWGRLTQLAAMFVMPVLLALTWRLGRGWPRLWPLVSVAAAGLFLIHFRVFLFYVPFAVLTGVVQIAGHRRLRSLASAGLLALALVAPRVAQLLRATDPLQTVQQSLPGYNDFPVGYVTTGWERLYLALAVVALLIVVRGIVLRRRWVAFPLFLLAWVASLFVLLAGERLGLPETLVVNLNSMYITLFLPLSLFLAIVAGAAWRRAAIALRARRTRRDTPYWPVVAGIAAGIALGVLALFGWRQQVNILNRQTILAMPADIAGLAWLDGNLPPDARIAVNAWQWFGSTWAGSDGGAWITPLTGLTTTTPPIDHIYNPTLFAEVRAFNEGAIAVEDWSDPAAARLLSEKGITHIYVGQRGGYFDPAELARNPLLTRIYDHNGVFIFAVNG